jgi:hypothetical protein
VAITNGYVTLASMKNYLGITDSIDDTLLEEIVESASRSIDRIANRYFYLDSTASERRYRTTDAYSLIVDDIGSLTGLVITLDTAGSGTFSTSVTINTDYLMEPLNSASLGRPWTISRWSVHSSSHTLSTCDQASKSSHDGDGHQSPTTSHKQHSFSAPTYTNAKTPSEASSVFPNSARSA